MKVTTLPWLLCVVMLLGGASEGGIFKWFCPRGWTSVAGRCFKFVPTPMTWAQAERHCLFMGGNLASVRRPEEHKAIKKFILGAGHKEGRTWIGGSNAAEVHVWLWSDGTRMQYTNWCPNEPNNYNNIERCLEMNHSGRKCWNDLNCAVHLPSVCARKRTWFPG